VCYTRGALKTDHLPQKLTALPTFLIVYSTMVSTRVSSMSSKSSSTRTAAFTRYHLTQSLTYKKDYSTRLLNSWDAWYDAFAAEVKDEFPGYTTTKRRQEAESRWSSFASKSLKCSEATVRSWLSSSSSRSTRY
jgi:hypothetical protein